MLRAARTELRSRSSERFLDQVPRICPHARTVPVGRVPCFPDFLMDTQVENNQGRIRNRKTRYFIAPPPGLRLAGDLSLPPGSHAAMVTSHSNRGSGPLRPNSCHA